jgi:hypothetical protein
MSDYISNVGANAHLSRPEEFELPKTANKEEVDKPRPDIVQ